MSPSPKRKPGPKSRTKGRGASPPPEEPAPELPDSSSSDAGSTRSHAKLYKCSLCGRIFADIKDCARHKKAEHADQCTHITGASSVSQFVAPTGRPLRSRAVAAGAPDGDGDGSDNDANNSPPPSPKKRNKRQGRNRSPLPIGRKKRVKGPDGVVRDEIERGPRFTSG